jgi:amino acid permease
MVGGIRGQVNEAVELAVSRGLLSDQGGSLLCVPRFVFSFLAHNTIFFIVSAIGWSSMKLIFSRQASHHARFALADSLEMRPVVAAKGPE